MQVCYFLLASKFNYFSEILQGRYIMEDIPTFRHFLSLDLKIYLTSFSYFSLCRVTIDGWCDECNPVCSRQHEAHMYLWTSKLQTCSLTPDPPAKNNRSPKRSFLSASGLNQLFWFSGVIHTKILAFKIGQDRFRLNQDRQIYLPLLGNQDGKFLACNQRKKWPNQVAPNNIHLSWESVNCIHLVKQMLNMSFVFSVARVER